MTDARQQPKREGLARIASRLKPGGDHGRRLRDIGHLLTGNLAGSMLGLLAFALSARALGVEDYGRLALIYAYIRVVERIVSFQSWQPIIRFGAGLDSAEHRDDLRTLLKFGLALDLGAALLAFLVALLGAHLVAPLFGWESGTVELLSLYALVLLFQINGMPTAVQRLAGRFQLMAYGQLGNGTLRVVLCLYGIQAGLGLGYFAAVWAGTQILGSLTTLALAFATLRRQGLHGILRAPLRGVTRRFPGLWGFTWSANLSLTLRMSTQELDTLLVGALADPASAGLYQIAKRIGRVGQQVGQQVQAVLYPDVARLWAKGRIAEFRRTVVQVELALAGFGLLAVAGVAAIIHPLLRWTAGPEFLGAAPLVVVQMVAVAFILSGSAARAALLAMGRHRDVLVVVTLATLAFHLSAIALIPRVGAMGGNLAHILLGILWLGGLAWCFHRALAAARPLPPSGLAPEGI